MKILENRWVIFGIFAALVLLPTLLMFLDSACSPITSEICRQWLNFQWETVLAGGFGLMGGIFVIVSTRQQIAAQREDMAAAELADVDKVYRACIQMTANLKAFIESAEKRLEANPNATWREIRGNWPEARKMELTHHFKMKVLDRSDFPKSLRKATEQVYDQLADLHAIDFDQNTPPTTTLTAIKEINDAAEENIKTMQSERNTHAKLLMIR